MKLLIMQLSLEFLKEFCLSTQEPFSFRHCLAVVMCSELPKSLFVLAVDLCNETWHNKLLIDGEM
jgi:hypothetical protein